MGELQDKNGIVALVTLKFELEQWLNGNLVNSLIVRKENVNFLIACIKELIKEIKNYQWSGLNFYMNNKNIDILKEKLDRVGILWEKTQIDQFREYHNLLRI